MSLADELEKLRDLRDSGALTDAEFERAKAAVLNGPPVAQTKSPPSDPPDEQNALPPWVVWLRNLALVLAAFGLLISMAWTYEARTVGRGFISTSLAPLAIVSNIASAVLIGVCWLAQVGRGRGGLPPLLPPEEHVASAEVALPGYPKP